MHAILAFADFGSLNLNSDSREKLGHYFNRIKESGSRLLMVINNLLELSTLEAGQVELKPAQTFDKFVHSCETDAGTGGADLGLSICREMIASHRGTIWADNAPENSGTIVHFIISVAYARDFA